MENNYYNIIGDNKIKMVFKIPVGEISKEEAEKNIKELIKSYKDEIKFDDGMDSVNFYIKSNLNIDEQK